MPLPRLTLLAAACAASCACTSPRPTPPIATDPGIDSIFAYLVQRYDLDGDGTVSQTEYDRGADQFVRWDRDEDGRLTETDFERPGTHRRARPSGSASTSPEGNSNRAAQEVAGDSLAAQTGERAPDFTLESPDGKQRATLSAFADSKPVALIFGSYT